MSIGNPKIWYNSMHVEFTKKPIDIQHPLTVERTINSSPVGNSEFLVWNTKENLRVTIRYEDPLQANAMLRDFFQYAKDGSTFGFLLDTEKGAYWAFEGKTFLNNNGVTGSTARTTTGQYEDYYTGLLKTAVANETRYVEGKFGAGILTEALSTNYISSITFAGWTRSSMSLQDAVTFICDNYGSFNASIIEATGALGSISYDTGRLISLSDIGSFPVYAKAFGAISTLQTRLYKGAGGSMAASANHTLGANWKRLNITTLAHGWTGSSNWYAAIQLYGSGNRAAIAHPQFEEKSYPTSYMRTDTPGSAFSRGIDLHTFTFGQYEIDEKQGTLLFWLKPLFNPADGITQNIFTILNDDGRTFMSFTRFLTNVLTVTFGGVMDTIAISLGSSDHGLVANQWVHYGITWNFTESNGMSVFVNGVHAGISVSSPASPIKLPTRMQMSGASYVIDEISVERYAMSASSIADEAGETRGRGLARNYYSNMQLVDGEHSPRLINGRPFYEVELNFSEYL